MEGMIGEIRMFGGNFAPRSWALCEGQLLAISSNTALFSILGTTYGGDGRTTFALPDLRGRVAIQPGTGPGLSTYRLGQRGGVENVTLNTTQIPSHTHAALYTGATTGGNLTVGSEGKAAGKSSNAADNYLGDAEDLMYRTDAGTGSIKGVEVTSEGTVAIGNTGGNLHHENRQPLLAVNFIICLVGIFPSRS